MGGGAPAHVCKYLYLGQSPFLYFSYRHNHQDARNLPSETLSPEIVSQDLIEQGKNDSHRQNTRVLSPLDNEDLRFVAISFHMSAKVKTGFALKTSKLLMAGHPNTLLKRDHFYFYMSEMFTPISILIALLIQYVYVL